MSKEREIIDLLNDIVVDEDEFNNIAVELNDIEKKRIRKNYRKKILVKKRVLKGTAITAALAAAIFLGGITVPAMTTSNIPVLGSIYDTLGIYSEYKDYTKYIGETAKAGKYKYSIEEFMVTPYKSLIGIKITSDDIISEQHGGFIADIEIGGGHWDSGSSNQYRVDDHTVITTIEHNYNKKVPKKADIKVSIHSINSNDDPNETYGKFEFKADFDKSYSEFTSINVDNIAFDKYGIKLKEINSSIMGTDIISEMQSKEDDEAGYLSEKDKLEYVLKVDGKFYNGDKYRSLDSSIFGGVEGVAITQIHTLKFDKVASSKDMRLLVYEAKYADNQLSSTSADAQGANTVEQGISYVKEYKFKDGTKGLFYNLERDKNTVTIRYKGNESDIVPLSKYLSLRLDKKRVYYPDIYKELDLEGEFIIEFSNVPQGNEALNMTFGGNNEYSLIGEYKIK